MKKPLLQLKHIILFLFLLLGMVFSACKKEPALTGPSIPNVPETQRLLVNHIFDFDSTLRYAFDYNQHNQLVKCRMYDQNGMPESELQFEYVDDKLESYWHYNLQFTDVDLYMFLSYDSLDRLSYYWSRFGFNNIFAGRYDYGTTNKVQGIYTDTTVLRASFYYANGPNCVTHTKHQNGTVSSSNFEYDSFKKPDFGLENIYPLQLLWHLTEIEEEAQAVSKHNLTKNLTTGTTFTYTYNVDGYPITIETRRNGQALPNHRQYWLTYRPLN